MKWFNSLALFDFTVKSHLKARYKDVAGRIITMALESVDYSEEKACKILEIVMQDDKGAKEEIKREVKGDACVDNETSPPIPTGSTETAESVPDAVDHEERYDRFLFVIISVRLNIAKSQKLLHR